MYETNVFSAGFSNCVYTINKSNSGLAREREAPIMSHDFSSIPSSRNGDTTLVIAETESFVAFDRWIDEQLSDLVARWIHMAAPNANRPELLRERFAH
jgi:hypothetical protein